MLKAIIVDDEDRSIENLAQLLEVYCSEIELVATAKTIQDACIAIETYKPSIVFLDIDMPPDTGFDLLKKYDELPFDVIFVTAYDYYAIDAIKFSALYYVMKPIKADELREAVTKAIKKHTKNGSIPAQFIKSIHGREEKLKRIVVNTLKESEIIDLDDIYYIEAKNVYSILYMNGNKKLVCSQRSLKDYNEMLADKGFFRCHKSYLVNLHQIASLDKHEGNEIILKDKSHIPLARRRKEELMSLLMG
jgi:two-component system LytT family response regulator